MVLAKLKLIFILVFAYFIGACSAQYSYALEDGLRSALFSSYNIYARPTASTTVTMSLSIFSLHALDMKAESMSVAGYLFFTWSDSRLNWSSNSTYNGTVPVFYTNDDTIWVPTMIVENSVSNIGIIDDGITPIRVKSSGDVEWPPARLFETSCEIDVTYYPFDSQSCDIVLTTWGYTTSDIPLVFDTTPVTTTYYKQNGEWDYVGYSTSSTSGTRHGNSIVLKSFILKFRRKPMFQFLNTILPTVLLAILNGVIFKLPADCGEKNGFVLTVLLSYAVYLTIVSSEIPKTSKNICCLSVYLIIILILSVVSVIVTGLSLNYYFRDDEKDPMPDCTKKALIFLDKIARFKICCRKATARVAESPNAKDVKLKNIQDDEKEADDTDSYTEDTFTWKQASEVIDDVCFVIYYTIVVIVTFIVGVFLLHGYLK